MRVYTPPSRAAQARRPSRRATVIEFAGLAAASLVVAVGILLTASGSLQSVDVSEADVASGRVVHLPSLPNAAALNSRLAMITVPFERDAIASALYAQSDRARPEDRERRGALGRHDFRGGSTSGSAIRRAPRPPRSQAGSGEDPGPDGNRACGLQGGRHRSHARGIPHVARDCLVAVLRRVLDRAWRSLDTSAPRRSAAPARRSVAVRPWAHEHAGPSRPFARHLPRFPLCSRCGGWRRGAGRRVARRLRGVAAAEGRGAAARIGVDAGGAAVGIRRRPRLERSEGEPVRRPARRSNPAAGRVRTGGLLRQPRRRAARVLRAGDAGPAVASVAPDAAVARRRAGAGGDGPGAGVLFPSEGSRAGARADARVSRVVQPCAREADLRRRQPRPAVRRVRARVSPWLPADGRPTRGDVARSVGQRAAGRQSDRAGLLGACERSVMGHRWRPR